jgi:hypothetical protein
MIFFGLYEYVVSNAYFPVCVFILAFFLVFCKVILENQLMFTGQSESHLSLMVNIKGVSYRRLSFTRKVSII